MERNPLIDVLMPFAIEADRYDPYESDDDQPAWQNQFTIGELRAARAALAAIEAEGAWKAPTIGSEVMRHITENTSLNKLRAIFSGEAARIEQAQSQLWNISAVEMRQMEFSAVVKILNAAAAPSAPDSGEPI